MCRFVTPNHKSELCSTPRTPTPFKSAMEKYGPLHPLVSILTWAAEGPEHGCIILTLALPFYRVVQASDSKSGGGY